MTIHLCESFSLSDSLYFFYIQQIITPEPDEPKEKTISEIYFLPKTKIESDQLG